jgi:hypothetical protein
VLVYSSSCEGGAGKGDRECLISKKGKPHIKTIGEQHP